QVSNTCSNGEFSLSFEAMPKQPVNQKTVVTKVSAGPAIWSAEATARAKLREQFGGFLAAVEALEGETLIPGATRRIARELANAIPAAPVETLFFHYGLSTGMDPKTLPYVDVLPGMRLRIEAQASQFISPAGTDNGFLPAGEILAEVGSVQGGETRVVAFDPFLGTIRAPTVGGAVTVPTVAGGLVDFEPSGGARAHWRLFSPQQVEPPSRPGRKTVAGNFTLVGAPTYVALEEATASFPEPPSNKEAQPLYLVVLGRALVVPEVPVWITLKGLTTIEHVRLGTTLTNVIERYTPVPLEANPGAPPLLMRVVGSSTTGFTIYSDGLPAYTPELFDLPLIAGDSITIPV
ncbi:MAG TPA: hypothetical protein VF729_02205, partial [Solirubrobacterales bacterium]